jgi:hypothetical protein
VLVKPPGLVIVVKRPATSQAARKTRRQRERTARGFEWVNRSGMAAWDCACARQKKLQKSELVALVKHWFNELNFHKFNNNKR